MPDDEPIRVDGTLEHIADGVVVRATRARTVDAPPCSRCLQPVSGELIAVHVDELFEPAPLEGETYQLDDDVLDLLAAGARRAPARAAARRRCAEDCAGSVPTCGADRNTTPCDCAVDDLDPRWAALRSLETR